VPTVALVKVVLEDYLLTRPAYDASLASSSEAAEDVPD